MCMNEAQAVEAIEEAEMGYASSTKETEMCHAVEIKEAEVCCTATTKEAEVCHATVIKEAELCHTTTIKEAELCHTTRIKEAEVCHTTNVCVLPQTHRESVLELEYEVMAEEGQDCWDFVEASRVAFWACLPETHEALMYPLQLLTGNVPLAAILGIPATT